MLPSIRNINFPTRYEKYETFRADKIPADAGIIFQ